MQELLLLAAQFWIGSSDSLTPDDQVYPIEEAWGLQACPNPMTCRQDWWDIRVNFCLLIREAIKEN